jgi:hypothetical protein
VELQTSHNIVLEAFSVLLEVVVEAHITTVSSGIKSLTILNRVFQTVGVREVVPIDASQTLVLRCFDRQTIQSSPGHAVFVRFPVVKPVVTLLTFVLVGLVSVTIEDVLGKTLALVGFRVVPVIANLTPHHVCREVGSSPVRVAVLDLVQTPQVIASWQETVFALGASVSSNGPLFTVVNMSR